MFKCLPLLYSVEPEITECLFFLNTPNALTSQEAASTTQSPWIYAEIALTHIVRRKAPARHKQLVKLAENAQLKKSAVAHMVAEYQIGTESLVDINAQVMGEWAKKHEEIEGHALDVLYNLA